MPNRRDPDAPGRGAGKEENREPRSPHPRKSPPPVAESSLEGVPWELPHNFLGLDEEASALEKARAVILPVPYESTTSFGGGTRRGPRAILEASRYVELWDPELGRDASRMGIHTLPAVELSRAGPQAAMDELEGVWQRLLAGLGGRFLVMLGGEHSISGPAIRAVAAHAGTRIHVLQFDAHADLRESYEGTPFSHASVMFRALEVADVVAVGIRGISQEEVELARSRRGITLVYAHEMWEDDGWMDRALEALGDPVYLTFDVDFFDPSLVPATGTPEPGGGDWYRTLRFLRRVFRERTVLAADVVELAPIPGMPAPDFLVAKLVYKLLAYADEGRRRTSPP